MDTPPSSLPPSNRPALLGQLLSETTQYAKAHWQPLLVGAVVFGVILGGLNMVLGAQTALSVQRGMDNMDVDVERMEELSGRIEAGDEAALDELEAMLEDSFGDMTDQQMMQQGAAVAGQMAPAILLGALVSMLFGFLAHAYYSLVAVEGKDMSATIGRATKVMLPLAGVSILSFLRTFVWLPLLGLILVATNPLAFFWLLPIIVIACVALGLLFGPRFIASSLIYLAEGKGVSASVSESYRRTNGYWGKIVGNLLVMGLILFVASFVINMVLGIVLSSVPPALMILSQVVAQIFMAISTVFTVRLSHTILQHPRA